MAGPNLFMEFVVEASALSTGETQTKNVFNVFHFQRLSGSIPPLKADNTTLFVANIVAKMALALSVSWVGQRVRCRFIDDALDPYLDTSIVGTVGAITGDSLPSVNSVSMQLNSGVRGRAFRGAKRFGVVAESDTTLDHLITAAVTRYTAIGTAILAGWTDAGGNIWTPCIVSKKAPANYETNPCLVMSVPCTGFVLKSVLGIMRRRRQKVA